MQNRLEILNLEQVHPRPYIPPNAQAHMRLMNLLMGQHVFHPIPLERRS
jgi:hypothetical protein